MCYRIIFGLVNVCVSAFFELNCTSQTRGHPYKLYKPRTCSSLSYFSIRVISVWNSLPADCVDFSSFASFKRAVKQADVTQFLLCYHVWLNITRICILHIIIISLLLVLLSASLYVSRDVVGRWSLIVGWSLVGWSLVVTRVHCGQTVHPIFEIFSPSGSDTILVFPSQRGCRYSDGNPPKWGVECKGVW